MIFIAFKIEPTNTKTAIAPSTAAVRRAEARRMANVEVVLEEIEATERSEAPDNCLKSEILNPNYNEYLNLAGWR